MENSPDNEDKKDSWWKKALLILVALLSAAVAKVVVQEAFKAANKPSKNTIAAAIDKNAYTSSRNGLMGELKEFFPSDYTRIRDHMAEEMQTTSDPALIRAHAASLTRQFLKDHNADIGRAPDNDLYLIAKTNYRFIVQLRQTSLQACADYSTKETFDPTTVPPETLGVLNDLGGAQVRAVRHGIDAPTERATNLTEDDQKAFFDAISAQGISTELIKKISSGGLSTATTDQQCSAGKAIYGGIVSLPSNVAARITAVLLSGR